jgi:hypothetical protein
MTRRQELMSRVGTNITGTARNEDSHNTQANWKDGEDPENPKLDATATAV